jgi:DNA-binding transcriptional MerR regulator
MEKIDRVIQHLKEAGVNVNEMVDALEIPRGIFYSWRKSTKLEKRDDMAEKLTNRFKQFFPDGWEIEDVQSTEAKYIALLESQITELKKDKQELYKVIEDLREMARK